MRITFITPTVFVKRNPIYRFGGKLYGHSNSITGPLILGGILKTAGHDVEVYEELEGSVDYKRLLERTDVLCLYTMTSTTQRAYELADLFHAQGHARVLIGGIHASAMPEEALEHADQVITGEGETVILDVVEGRITDDIVKAAPLLDLDAVPFPDYSILKTPCEAANVISSRGCPFRCTFCTTSRMFAPYRKRSVDNVIEEIRRYHEMGFRYMNFEDDNFTADKERAKEICRRIIDEHLQFKETFFFGRTDLANDEELLDLLAKAHLTRVLIGIESLNQDALDAVNKHQNIEDIKRATLACRDHGIRVIASVVLGLDEDSISDIRRTIEFASSVDAYQLQPAILTPYPGTPVWNQFEKDGRILDISREAFDMMNVTFQPKNMSPWDLQEEFYHAVHSFYNVPSAIRIGRLFGAEYGWRRFYLAICAAAGPVAARVASNHAKNSMYFKIRHTPWIYAPIEQEPVTAEDLAVHRQYRRLRPAAASRQVPSKQTLELAPELSYAAMSTEPAVSTIHGNVGHTARADLSGAIENLREHAATGAASANSVIRDTRRRVGERVTTMRDAAGVRVVSARDAAGERISTMRNAAGERASSMKGAASDQAAVAVAAAVSLMGVGILGIARGLI